MAVTDMLSALDSLTRHETNSLMMRNPVPQNVELRQFVEHKGMIVLDSGVAAWLVGEDAEQRLARGPELGLGKQIPPKTKI